MKKITTIVIITLSAFLTIGIIAGAWMIYGSPPEQEEQSQTEDVKDAGSMILSNGKSYLDLNEYAESKKNIDFVNRATAEKIREVITDCGRLVAAYDVIEVPESKYSGRIGGR